MACCQNLHHEKRLVGPFLATSLNREQPTSSVKKSPLLAIYFPRFQLPLPQKITTFSAYTFQAPYILQFHSMTRWFS